MRPPEPQICMTLKPYDKREGCTLNIAAGIAGKSVGTLRNWCISHGLGRRVGAGTWVVSRVALAMFLDGEYVTLAAYQAGERHTPSVKSYFDRLRIPLPEVQCS